MQGHGNVISFAEVVKGRDSSVKITSDGLMYAVDLVIAVTGQSRNVAAKTLSNIPADVFPKENLILKKISPTGGRPKTLVTFHNAIDLVMALPGKMAKQIRGQVASIIREYMDENNIQADIDQNFSLNQFQNQSSVLSFSEVVKDRNANVRITSDGMVHAVDLTVVFTGKDPNQSTEILRRIPEDIFPSSNFVTKKTPGTGNAHTKLLSFANAIELIMVLPGKIAKEVRSQFADIIRRYLAGDATLAKEIEANAAADEPIQKAARASLKSNPMKRKRLVEEAEGLDMIATSCMKFSQGNPHYKEFIQLKKEEYELDLKKKEEMLNIDLKVKEEMIKIEVKGELEKLGIERQKHALLNESRKDDLKYQRELKALNANQPASSPEQSGLLTIYKVFRASADKYAALRNDQVKSFMVKAGQYAASAYVDAYGLQPFKVDENGMKVNAYPAHNTSLVTQALSKAYREAIGGPSQMSLTASFFRVPPPPGC